MRRRSAFARVRVDLGLFTRVAATDQRQMRVGMRRENRRDGIDQLLPPFPRAHAYLRDQKAVVSDAFLTAKRTYIPFVRIEERDVRPRIDDDHLLPRQSAAGDDHI